MEQCAGRRIKSHRPRNCIWGEDGHFNKRKKHNHTAKIIHAGLMWPSQSLDMNPVEHLQRIMKLHEGLSEPWGVEDHFPRGMGQTWTTLLQKDNYILKWMFGNNSLHQSSNAVHLYPSRYMLRPTSHPSLFVTLLTRSWESLPNHESLQLKAFHLIKCLSFSQFEN